MPILVRGFLEEDYSKEHKLVQSFLDPDKSSSSPLLLLLTFLSFDKSLYGGEDILWYGLFCCIITSSVRVSNVFSFYSSYNPSLFCFILRIIINLFITLALPEAVLF
jgi:hypothetical protein